MFPAKANPENRQDAALPAPIPVLDFGQNTPFLASEADLSCYIVVSIRGQILFKDLARHFFGSDPLFLLPESALVFLDNLLSASPVIYPEVWELWPVSQTPK